MQDHDPFIDEVEGLDAEFNAEEQYDSSLELENDGESESDEDSTDSD